MKRPGFLNGFKGIASKRAKINISLGNLEISRNLGNFGKGFIAPSPAPPPITTAPPQYIEGKWQCTGTQPPSEADGYFFCCPDTGWTKVGFEDRKPCGENYGQTKCGPIPEGATTADAVCCEKINEWAPRDVGGGDPCLQAALLKAETTGKAIPGVAQTILTEDIEFDNAPLISPVVMIAGGAAIALLFIVTLVIKLKS